MGIPDHEYASSGGAPIAGGAPGRGALANWMARQDQLEEDGVLEAEPSEKHSWADWADKEDEECEQLGNREGPAGGWEYRNWRVSKQHVVVQGRRSTREGTGGKVEHDEGSEVVGVGAVEKSEARREESTQRINDRIKQKEVRWSTTERESDHTEALDCAKGAAARYDHPHAEEPDWRSLYGDGYFIDDVKGGRLDKEQVIQARQLEMAFFRDMGVYRKMPRSHLPPGARTITTKWVDTNKGTDEEPNYRSRLVGREIKTDERPDLFAATPPLESLRYVLSLCASTQWNNRPHRILSVDVKRAYFYAPARRPIFIELPAEDRLPGDEDKVAQLNLSLYGTRDAAQNWTKEYTRLLQSAGFTAGKVSPCNFYHKERGMALIVHGDDFTVSGPEGDLVWLRDYLAVSWEIKATSLGPESHQAQEISVLNRRIR